MFKFFIILSLSLSTAFADDVTSIKKVLNNYFQGYQRADSKLIQKAFHQDTKLISVDNNKLDALNLKDWVISIDARREREDFRKGSMQILTLDITQETAMVKLHLNFEKFEFIDYLSFLKVENKWIIVGKIFHFQEK